MVSGTLKLKQLIAWNLMYDLVSEDKDVFISYYPDATTMLKIKLDQTSMATLRQKRDQIIAFLETSVQLSGDIQERWEKKLVTKPSETVEEWVRVA